MRGRKCREIGKRFVRSEWALLLFTFFLLFFSIWGLELSGRDSPRVAGIAREMAVTLNFWVPRLNGADFLEYPPLGYWPVALSFLISASPSDFLAYLPVVLLGTGTVMITFLIGKTLAGEQVGFIAGFILATTSGFVSLHRNCTVDPALVFFITLSLYGFVGAYASSQNRLLFLSLFYFAMACAFLSKGISGCAIPSVVVLLFLLIRKDPSWLRTLHLPRSVLFFLIPIFLWAGFVWWIEGPGVIGEVFGQSLIRFASRSADHANPFYFYVIPAFLKPMPWSPFIILFLWCRFRGSRRRVFQPDDNLPLFALIWAGTVFVGLSLASAKRVAYLGPIYPPLALLSALGWNQIRERFQKVKKLELYGLLVLAGVYLGCFLLFITPSERHESLRPLFEIVSKHMTRGEVYLVNPCETTRGAAFFYLGRKIPVLDKRELFSGRFQDTPGKILVVDSRCEDDPVLFHLQSRGYRLWRQRGLGRAVQISMYTLEDTNPERSQKATQMGPR